MINTTKSRYAEDITEDDELDLEGDEYCDNENAVYGYALVADLFVFYKNREPWVKLVTSQGEFEVPAGHKMKVKVAD